jgi:uridylate kinase
MHELAESVAQTIPNAFQGDAHALLVAVYRDPRFSWETRIDAAKAAIRFEKPMLASATVDATFRRDPSTLSDAELAAIAGLGSPGAPQAEGNPPELDDMVH